MKRGIQTADAELVLGRMLGGFSVLYALQSGFVCVPRNPTNGVLGSTTNAL
jgi:hypothetical protein